MKTNNRIARTIVLVVSLMLSFPVFGQNADAVDLRLASRVGENFIKLNPGVALSGEPGSLRRVETDKFPNLYIFNADDIGFIIVAGDKRVQPILGFSDESTFDPNDMAPAAEMIIGGYDYVVDSMVRYNVRSTDESIRQAWIDLENGYYQERKGTRDEEPQYPLAYGPLLTTSWEQGSMTNWENNYNQYCPWTDNDGNGDTILYRAITGCVPTAMAQILFHYKKNLSPQTYSLPFFSKDNLYYYLEDIHGNTVRSGLGSSYPREFEIGGWNYSQSNSKKLAAKMMIDCGLLVNAQYGFNDTRADEADVLPYFQNEFGFSQATQIFRVDYNYDDWTKELKKSISNTMPICYGGTGRTGATSPSGGHEYVLDGYYTDPNDVYFHHVGTYPDGYYSINLICSADQSCIILAPTPEIYNKTINYRDEYRKTIHGKEYVVKYGLTPSVSQTQIVYNAPGDYHIHDMDGNTDIIINVKVLPSSAYEYNISRTICQGEPFYKDVVDYAGHVYVFKLSSDSTQYFGSQDFVRYSYDNVSGTITGKCTLTLTTEECNNCTPDVSSLNNGTNGSKDGQTTNQIIYESVTKYYEYMYAMKDFMSRVLMEAYWQDNEKEIEFWNLFQSLLDSNTGLISEEGIQQLISQSPLENISDDYIRIIAEGYNQSVMYWNEGYYTNESLPEAYEGMIEYDTAAMRKAYEAQAYAESLGFSDVRQMYDNAYEMLESEIENQQTSVCARVTVQFTQKMTMTREAFNGTLQIFNGHESIPMQNILVDFRIKDAQGNDCTNLFQINTLSLDQITGISGDGSLAAQTNGTALVQFIPTRNAAPTQPTVYYFGGSFSFIDPFTGEGLTYPLYPVDITVNPSPDLYVDYFMQRDILGDDALTLGVIEPSIPAELGVIIHNKGAGIAKNVTLETAEPEIIDNEHGLAIEFAMYGASFNGSPRQLGLMEIPFGNIESGQTAVGEWLFTSSLLGHFVSYTAHVIHNSSYDNPDLSLVSHLDIHELVHPIYAYGNLDDGINDFLVNDNPDAYDTPDSIYFSHGGKTSVGVVNGISFDHYVSPSDTIVTLTVVPSRIGWNYGVTDDPGMNEYEIISCIRNEDNQVIPLNNVWQTFVTIPDGGDPVYENKLHIVDTIPVGQTTTYTLVFAKSANQNNSVAQATTLTEGWNWWSSYIDMATEQDFNKLKTALGSNASMIKSRTDGFVTYMGGWYGTLQTINNQSMYMINMNSEQTISITGTLANLASNPITINNGWNWIGYPANVSVDINSALVNMTPTESDLIKTRNAFATYHSSMGGWFGSLTSLTPGLGYMYQSNNEEQFEFVYSTITRTDIEPLEVQMTNHWEISVGEYSDNATLIGVIAINGEEQRNENLIIGAFIDDRCVGEANAIYIEPFDRYFVFLNYFGNENDAITFRLYDGDSGIETIGEETSLVFNPNSVIGAMDDPYIINFGTLGMDEFAKEIKLFPNPVEANGKVNVSLKVDGVTSMRVEIVNTLGVAVCQDTYHTNAADIKVPQVPGIYIVKMTGDNGLVYYGKLIVE